MRSTLALTGVILALALTGCTDNPTPSTGSPSGPGPLTASAVAAAPTTPTLPKCADVFAPGKVIDQEKAKAGCLAPDGTVIGNAGQRCNDGRTLWQVDASTGAPGGFGFGGGTYQAQKGADVAADPAYKAAYNACRA